LVKKTIYLFFFLVFIQSLFSLDYIKVYYNKISNYEYAFYVDNNNFCPYQVYVKPELDKDLTSDIKFPYYNVIKPQTKGKYLFSIYPKTARKELTVKFGSFYAFGDPGMVNIIEESYPYYFPFEDGQVFKVTQGYNTRGTHSGASRYSVDFGMSIGTPVCASRDGVVVGVKDTSTKGGPYRKYRYYANYIIIYHDDGTFSEYLHLKSGGSAVKVGDKVKAGDIIGFSGNTGYTLGPHLHFMVLKPMYLTYTTVLARFMTNEGILVQPEFKKLYASFHNNTDKSIASGKKPSETNTDTGVGGP
jgi:murein DD-endopeptidase MepM/ murein hydrolase activator NlpD